jgi:1-acyl-sn-glycerol-3-phosphate acyltransferase
MLSVETRNILALCVLAGLAGLLGGWIVRMLRRSPFTPVQSLLYALNYTLGRVLWRERISGALPIPPHQGALIICNHRCPLDPSFIALTTSRVVHWMVAKEYCEFWVFHRLLQTCGVISVNRGGADRAAIKEAIRLISSGELVGIFPEGRINTTPQTLLPGHPGAALIAMKAHATVVPCYVHGAPYDGTTLGCMFMPASVRLTIGQPLDLSAYFARDGGRDTRDELTLQLLHELASVGGQPDFQPQLARTTAETADTKKSSRSPSETLPRQCVDGPS